MFIVDDEAVTNDMDISCSFESAKPADPLFAKTGYSSALVCVSNVIHNEDTTYHPQHARPTR